MPLLGGRAGAAFEGRAGAVVVWSDETARRLPDLLLRRLQVVAHTGRAPASCSGRAAPASSPRPRRCASSTRRSKARSNSRCTSAAARPERRGCACSRGGMRGRRGQLPARRAPPGAGRPACRRAQHARCRPVASGAALESTTARRPGRIPRWSEDCPWNLPLDGSCGGRNDDPSIFWKAHRPPCSG